MFHSKLALVTKIWFVSYKILNNFCFVGFLTVVQILAEFHKKQRRGDKGQLQWSDMDHGAPVQRGHRARSAACARAGTQPACLPASPSDVEVERLLHSRFKSLHRPTRLRLLPQTSTSNLRATVKFVPLDPFPSHPSAPPSSPPPCKPSAPPSSLPNPVNRRCSSVFSNSGKNLRRETPSVAALF